MVKKYVVDLKDDERESLKELITSGTQRVRKGNHARILLRAHEGWTDQEISEALDVSIPTIERVRQRFVEEGIEQALSPRRSRRNYQSLIDGVQEAYLIALACGQPPAGYRRWSLRLLASEMVRLEYIEEVSHETVRCVMNENELKPWLKREWCIPPKHNAEFVYHMEDILNVYQRPADPKCPMVCFDESPTQLIREKRQRIPVQSGQPERYDYEYTEKEQPICSCFLLRSRTGDMSR